jgi:hypothetical protein
MPEGEWPEVSAQFSLDQVVKEAADFRTPYQTSLRSIAQRHSFKRQATDKQVAEHAWSVLRRRLSHTTAADECYQPILWWRAQSFCSRTRGQPACEPSYRM